MKRGTLVALTGVLVAAGLASRAIPATWAVPTARALLLVSSIIATIPIARNAFAALRYRAFSIDLLVTIAVVGAVVVGEYTESAVVSFLFLFGNWLEARSLERTRRSIRALVEAAPSTARVERDGVERRVPVEEITPGSLLLVKAGDSVPVDGTIEEGSGYLDQASITGEPVPARRTVGDRVFAGTTLQNGFLRVRATQVGTDTTFAKIVELVEEAQDSKAPRQRFLDRFAAIYTPVIIVAAIAFGLFMRDIRPALTFLVIACPGALVIATPVAMVAALGNGTARGVIIKGGAALESLAQVDAIVFDKTGTLTKGSPQVIGVVSGGSEYGFSDDDVLQLAASLELASEHPLAGAIVEAARERALELVKPEDAQVLHGAGLEGQVGGRWVEVLSERAVRSAGGPSIPSSLHSRARKYEGATIAWVRADGRVIGFVAIADQLRPDAPEAVARLREFGEVVMLTGDNFAAATDVARRVGVDRVRAELMPQDKVEHVARLAREGQKVAMVGDGLNDAPALAAAEVGIAMGAGTDVSVETADVVLAGNRLDQLVHARLLARKAVAIMRENTAIALATVAVLVAGVLFGVVNMSIGMFVHEASVLAVILNALRLVRWRPRLDPGEVRERFDVEQHDLARAG